MKVEEKKFRLVGLQPLLGGVALDKEIFTKYIATKARDFEKENAKEDVENVIDENEKVTGFYRDVDTGNVIIKGYQIKGFMKEAAKALKDQLGLASCVSKIDNFVFIAEDNIPVMRGGEWIKQPDNFLERPLRGETPQGPRVSLAKSEQICGDWYIDITVKVIENKKTAKSVALDMGVVEELLSYGQFKGLLQWRNAGYGSFRIEEIES
jgi:hypothetical protein